MEQLESKIIITMVAGNVAKVLENGDIEITYNRKRTSREYWDNRFSFDIKEDNKLVGGCALVFNKDRKTKIENVWKENTTKRRKRK